MRYQKRKIVSLLQESEQSLFVDVLGNWFLLRGDVVRVLVKDLISYLEEPRSWEEIMQRFASVENISENEIKEVVFQLVRLGIVEEYDEELDGLSSHEKKKLAGVLDFFHLFTPYLEEKRGFSYLRRLQETSVVVMGRGTLSNMVVDLLCENGLGKVVAQGVCEDEDGFEKEKNSDLLKKANLTIVVGGKQNYGWFLKWNEMALKEGVPVLYVEEDWTGGIVGPLVIPGETACYQCYVDRRQSNDDNESVYQLMKEEKDFVGRNTNFAPLVWFLASMVVMESIKFLSSYLYPETLKGVFLVDGVNYRVHFHPVLKLPYCERCGYVDRIAPTMVWMEENRGV